MVQAVKITNRVLFNKRGWGSSPTILKNIVMPLSMTYDYIERIRLNNYASQIRVFSSKWVDQEGLKKDVKPLNLFDNSGSNESIIYVLYRDVYLKDNFKSNVGEILHDLELGNRENAEFKLYFIRKSPTHTPIDPVKLYNTLKDYSMDYILVNLTKFHQNMGVVFCLDFFLWSSTNHRVILVKIASNIETDMLDSISSINENVHKYFGNTTINFNTPIDLGNELFLFIVDER